MAMDTLRGVSFAEQIELTYVNSVPLAGSVGRAALLGGDISPLRPDGTPRDIDIVNVGQHEQSAGQLPKGYDDHWLNRFVDGSDLIYPGRKDGAKSHDPVIRVPFPEMETVLEAISGRSINGVPCIGLRPEVQLAFDGILGGVAPKNRESVKLLAKLVDAIPPEQKLDQRYLEPVHEYSAAVHDTFRRRVYAGARTVSYALLTPRIRAIAHPVMIRALRGRMV